MKTIAHALFVCLFSLSPIPACFAAQVLETAGNTSGATWQVTIQNPSKESLDIAISPDALVYDIKESIAKKVAIQVESQQLMFEEKVLQDEEKISYYKIENHDILQLAPSSQAVPSLSFAHVNNDKEQARVCLLITSFLTKKKQHMKLEVHLAEKVSFLKKKIEQETNLSPQHQKLMLKNTKICLDDQTPLSAYKLVNGSEISLYEKSKNLGMAFNFSSLNSKVDMTFDNTIKSKGMDIFPGLNLIGACKNQACDVTYHDQVCAPKGFGTFHLGTEMYTTACPRCKKELENVTTCAFSLCKYHIEGKKVKSGKFTQDGVHNQADGYNIFLAGDTNTTDCYLYIKVTVEKL